MQHYRIVSALLALFAAFSFSACYQDYPSGGDISIYSQKDRIMGTWIFGKNEANNQNVTGKYTGWTIDFNANGKVLLCDSSNTNCYTGTWNFVTQKSGLQIVMADSVVNLPSFQAVEFSIVRLTKAEVYLDYAGNKSDATEGIVRVPALYWELIREP